jgi:hypothetical protein
MSSEGPTEKKEPKKKRNADKAFEFQAIEKFLVSSAPSARMKIKGLIPDFKTL